MREAVGSATSMTCPNDNLVDAPTSFVGREGDGKALAAQLEHARVVTLLGPPGVGKSRLALEVARNQPEEAWPGGRWRCALGEVDDVELVRGLIVQVCNPNADPEAELGLPAERALVVLDEVDRLVGPLAANLRRWMAEAPHITWLLTARRRLEVEGEHCFDLGPLGDDAPALFEARARAHDHRFENRAHDDAVRRIVAALDGLPLALELAASRLRVLSAEQLAESLTSDLSLLDAPAGGLSRAIETSWALLPRWARDVTHQCTVFDGGFDLDSASAVIHFDDRAPIEALQTLVDSSWLVVDRSTRRFSMLSTLRRYVQRHGGAAFEAAEARHREWFIAKANAWRGADDRASLRRDRANLSRARAHALAGGDREAALDVAIALAALAPSLGYRWCHDQLEGLLSEQTNRREAEARLARGTLRRFLGRPGEAAEDLEQCKVMAQALGAPELEAKALTGLANGETARARWGIARPMLEDARALYAARGDRGNEGRLLSMIGATWFNEDDPEKAEASLGLALPLLREAQDRLFEAIATASLGFVKLARGDLSAAQTHLAEGRAALREQGDRHWVSVTDGYLGWAAWESGDREDGHARVGTAVASLARLGVERAEALARLQRGALWLADGEAESAIEELYAALRALRVQAPDHLGLVLSLLAGAAAERGEHASADAHLAEAEAALASVVRPGFATVLEWMKRAVFFLRARDAVARSEAPRGSLPPAPVDHEGAEVRLARGLAAKAEAAFEAERDAARRRVDVDALAVEVSGRWFRAPGGEAVSLRRRTALRQILACLAASRERDPGTALPVATLVEAGWPSERVMAKAGVDRVYNAVATLRRLGLREHLLRRDEGYLLDPETPLVIDHAEG